MLAIPHEDMRKKSKILLIYSSEASKHRDQLYFIRLIQLEKIDCGYQLGTFEQPLAFSSTLTGYLRTIKRRIRRQTYIV